jgi:type II secretory pathway pseudopilin PulG
MTLVEVVIALAITALTVGGIVSGYIYSSNAAMQDSLELAACTQAQARIEQARSAQWDVSAYPAVDQLVASNFPNQMVTLTQLDSPSNTVSATVQTTISQVSVSPPVRLIHVDCIWQYRDYTMTSSVETMRAPDE